MRSIEDTTVLVTGATDGLGRAVAERLAGQGATVLVHGRDPVKLASTAHQLREATGNGHVFPDISFLDEVLLQDVQRSRLAA